MPKQPLEMRFVQYPWLAQSVEALSIDGEAKGRFLVLPASVEQVTADVSHTSLPQVSRWAQGGKRWQMFELPAAVPREAGDMSETLRLTLRDRRLGSQRCSVLRGGALRPYSDIEEEARRSGATWDPSQTNDAETSATVAALSVLHSHVDFVDGLYDRPPEDSHWWQGNAKGMAIRSLEYTLEQWRLADSRDEPRLALIVKLARELPEVVSGVCHRPRVVLRRVRSMLGVGKVQEVDPSCLRWLARQPGRSLVEKAGPKQRVMAIERVENADTPENRVVRDLLLRGGVECVRYMIEHRRLASHSRVRKVREFRNLLGDLHGTTAVGEARPLVGIPQANYVLQHEPRYNRLWKAYLLLIRQQKQQDQLWRWRHRTWIEACGLALWDAMSGLGIQGSVWRSDVLLRDEQAAGQFLDPGTAPAASYLKARPEQTLTVVSAANLSRYGAPDELLRLRPDFALHVRDNTSDRDQWLAIWALVERAAEWRELQKATEVLNHTLKGFQTPRRHVQGLLIRLNLDDPDRSGSIMFEESHCQVASANSHLQSDSEFLSTTIHSLLRLP